VRESGTPIQRAIEARVHHMVGGKHEWVRTSFVALFVPSFRSCLRCCEIESERENERERERERGSVSGDMWRKREMVERVAVLRGTRVRNRRRGFRRHREHRRPGCPPAIHQENIYESREIGVSMVHRYARGGADFADTNDT
jgi:hypothetical protein